MTYILSNAVGSSPAVLHSLHEPTAGSRTKPDAGRSSGLGFAPHFRCKMSNLLSPTPSFSFLLLLNVFITRGKPGHLCLINATLQLPQLVVSGLTPEAGNGDCVLKRT